MGTKRDGQTISFEKGKVQCKSVLSVLEGWGRYSEMTAFRKCEQIADAETTPLRNPEKIQLDLHLGDIVEVWRRGSVIA